MKKTSSPSFVLELEISFSDRLLQERLPGSPQCPGPTFIDKKIKLANSIYNALLDESIKRLNKLQHDLTYKETVKAYAVALKEENRRDIKAIGKKIGEIKGCYGYTEFSMHEYAAKVKHYFNNKLGIDECQKLASRAFIAIEKVRKGEAKKVHFHHWYDDAAIEGKSYNSMIKYCGNYCIQMGKGNRFPLILKRKDGYAREALDHRIKYVRVVRKTIRGRKRYFAQIVLEGIPPRKKTLQYGACDSKIGLDEGTSTIAIVSQTEVSLLELAPDVAIEERELRRLNRAIDRSKRVNNPQNYNDDETMKKGKLKWYKSKNCIKLESRRKELYRRSAWKRKCTHNKLANHIVSLGTDIRVEDMRIQSLAKRARTTKINPPNGRIKSKKRYGKVITSRAPAMLISAVDRKLGYIGLRVKKIDTRRVKASQYDHKADLFRKKCISDRWHIFDDGTRIQRE